MRLRGGLAHPLLEPFLDSGGTPVVPVGRATRRPAAVHPRPGPAQLLHHRHARAISTRSPRRRARTRPGSSTGRPAPSASTRVDARDLNLWTLNLLAKESDTVVTRSCRLHTRCTASTDSAVVVSDVPDGEDGPADSLVKCTICGHVHAVPPADIEDWRGVPCLRYRCVGRFEAVDPPVGSQYYRSLYRSGTTRRVVTGEHTGLLRPSQPRGAGARVQGRAPRPTPPTCSTATPTLEMGIDIGDLSSVMLTSVPRNPASYIQRVGRAGRATGNALVTTFVRTDTHGLYYLAEPEAMIAGDVRPPDCYLDAVETLQRQYLAYLLDRIADQTIDGPTLPHQIGPAHEDRHGRGRLPPRRWSTRRCSIPATSSAFLGLFGDRLAPSTVDRLRTFAARRHRGRGQGGGRALADAS